MIEKYSQNKILKRFMMVLGIASAVARIGLLFGVLAGINIVGGSLSEQSTNEFMANLVVIIDVVAPYLIGLGVVSIFLMHLSSQIKKPHYAY